jgi:hypothetical protein
MNEADQLRRAKRWAEEIPNESTATTAALDALDPEVRSRVVEAANLGATMNIYRVSDSWMLQMIAQESKASMT